MKTEYDLTKMSSRKNLYASKLKKSVTMRLREDVISYLKDMPEIILKIGAEGGSITLYGFRSDDGFELFSIDAYDCSDDEAEHEASRDTSQISNPNSASSWPEALNLIKRYPSWYRLHPLVLHPDFESRILDEVRNCGGDAALKRWREALSET